MQFESHSFNPIKLLNAPPVCSRLPIAFKIRPIQFPDWSFGQFVEPSAKFELYFRNINVLETPVRNQYPIVCRARFNTFSEPSFQRRIRFAQNLPSPLFPQSSDHWIRDSESEELFCLAVNEVFGKGANRALVRRDTRFVSVTHFVSLLLPETLF